MSTNTSSSLAGGQVSGHVGWVPPPRGRGTINIIWSCLTVLLICSYKCLHLNIPHEDELEAGWHKLWGAIPYWPERPALRRLLRKVKWMAITIIAPEFVAGVAAFELQQARKDLADAKKRAPDFAKWLRERDELRRWGESGHNPPDSQPRNSELTLSHAFYARMGGFVHVTVDNDESGGPRMRRARLESVESYCRFLNQCASEKRAVHLRSESDIQGLVKSDHIAKVLAITQALYLVLDCIARTNQGLSISPLELSTAAYVLAAAATYGFWWHKPQDVAHVTQLCGDPEPSGTSGYKRAELIDDNHAFSIVFEVTSYLAPYVFHLVAALFGGVHVIAWRWDFGSDLVKTIWKVCAVATSAIPIFILCIILGITRPPVDMLDLGWIGWIKSVALACWIGATVVLSVCYVLGRAIIFFLSFYTLFSMPIGAYQTVAWTDYLPFIS
ncbi:hypothetical protein RB594_003740 [Gaeumannomyces avenae]